MKNHIYVLLSVFLWGISQFLIDLLLKVFSPVLLLGIRFLVSGIILLLLCGRANRKPFRWKYLFTGSLGAFGYYILMMYALVYSSVTFTAIMGGILPVIAVLFDLVVAKEKANCNHIIGAILSLLGIVLFSYNAKFTWNLVAVVLMIAANLSWVLYCYLKKRWKSTDDACVLGYEFVSTAVLTIPFISTYKITGNVTIVHILLLLAIIFLSTIFPYQLYLKGSAGISLSTASMYMNLLPIVSLLPVLVTGGLTLSIPQMAGIGVLVFSAVIGK